MTSVAIMQPTYLPWVGYFALMDRVDLFIYLDSVQFARRSWQQRNRIKTAQGELMLTIPVLKKGMREQQLCEVQILANGTFPGAHLKAIELSYAKAPYFGRYGTELQSLLAGHSGNLCDLTIGICEWLANSFGIRTPRMRSSQMDNQGAKADLLVHLCQQVGATDYVSPRGSADYLDDSTAFADAKIALHYHEYSHPHYQQLHGDFLPYMGAIDLLFHCGPESLSVIRSGVSGENG